MNFLAHLFLSGDNHQIRLGNFIADAVKGKAIYQFPESVQAGILFHRAIDTFTDQHEVVATSKARLRPAFRKYAPVIADVFYDHFLAKDWHRFNSMTLESYAAGFYDSIQPEFDWLPPKTKHLLPYMISGNWLVSYKTIEGINKVLTGMAKRTTFPSGMELAADHLQINYSFYEEDFNLFFPQLIHFAEEYKNRNLLNYKL